jgi:hypothetical protein
MAVLGLIDGLGEAFVSIAKAISGYWSDRIRKRSRDDKMPCDSFFFW